MLEVDKHFNSNNFTKICNSQIKIIFIEKIIRKITETIIMINIFNN